MSVNSYSNSSICSASPDGAFHGPHRTLKTFLNDIGPWAPAGMSKLGLHLHPALEMLRSCFLAANFVQNLSRRSVYGSF